MILLKNGVILDGDNVAVGDHNPKGCGIENRPEQVNLYGHYLFFGFYCSNQLIRHHYRMDTGEKGQCAYIE